MTSYTMKYENVDVDRAPENEPEKWERWGSLDELLNYLEDGLLQLAVDNMLKKTNNEDLRKEKIKPMEKLKKMASLLIWMNGDGVLQMLQASDKTIRGWQCKPTQYPNEEKKDKDITMR